MKPHQPFFKSIFLGVPVLGLMTFSIVFLQVAALLSSVSAWAFYHLIGASDSMAALIELGRVAITVSGVFMLPLLGVIRLIGFHPIWRPEYAAFLANTPYDGSQPLPFGPVGFVWKDVILVAGAALYLTVFCVVYGVNGWDAAEYAATLYAFPYVSMAAWTLIRYNQFWTGYFMAFAIVPMALVEGAPERIALVSVLIIAANRALASGLGYFPRRPDTGFMAGRTMRYTHEKEKIEWDVNNPSDMGWPFEEMPVSQHQTPMAWRHIGAISAWLFVVTLASIWRLHSSFSDVVSAERIPLHLTFSVVLLLLALATVFGFCAVNQTLRQRYRSNWSLLARIATGRLLVWSFDRLYLPPVYIVVVIFLTWKSALDFPYLIPFLAGAAPLVARWSVPDPKAFALTAPAIILPSGMANERFKRL